MMRLLAILFAALLFSASARADLAFVRASDLGDNNSGADNYTAAFNATGANLIIIGMVGDVASGGNDDIASFTYAGVAATFITKYAVLNGNEIRYSYLYFVPNPTTGSNNVVVTLGGSIHYISLGVAAYSGLGSSGSIPGASSSSIDSSTHLAYTSSLSTAPDRAWAMLFALQQGDTNVPTCSAGATNRTYGVLYNNWELCDSNGPVTPPQSYSMTATIGGTFFFQTHLMASFGPDSGGLMMRGCCQ